MNTDLAKSEVYQPSSNQRLKPGDRAPAIIAQSISGAQIKVPDSDWNITHIQFLRFAGCPVCNLLLQNYIRRINEIRAANIREVVFFYSEAKFVEDYYQQLPLDLIADPNRSIYKKYAVERSLWSIFSPQAWPNLLKGYKLKAAGKIDSTPFGQPAEFLVAPDGRIIDCHYGSHSSDQWSVDDILKIARQQDLNKV